MSDSLLENSFSGALKVLKLTSGEEIIALVDDTVPDLIKVSFPAALETYVTRDQENNMIEYIKLTNYLSNIKGNEIVMPKSVLVYMAPPNTELEKMYEVYFVTMQTDPKLVAPATTTSPDVVPGLQLLNELFNNEDFVNFVNDMVDQFEGIEDFFEETEDEVVETVSGEVEPEEPEPQPKKKKRRRIKPETNKLPYNPDQPPENPESWSDNPSDYF